MKLHTSLTGREVRAALERAISKRLIAPDVYITVWAASGSRTHAYGYDIQLGTRNRYSLPARYRNQHGKVMRYRKPRNSNHGAAEWAATWYEWGWFILEVFTADPEARWGPYASLEDFHRATAGLFADPDVREQTSLLSAAQQEERAVRITARVTESSAMISEAERKRAAIEAEFVGTWTNTLHP